MESWLYMLGISNITRSSLKKFIKDLVDSSPDLQNKIHTVSPISFSIKVDFLDTLFIQINDDGINIDFVENRNAEFSIDISTLEVLKYIKTGSVDRKHLRGDEERAFVFINMLKGSHIDLPILIERNFGHLPGALSYLVDGKMNKTSNVTINKDSLSKQLRSLSIRLDRLEAFTNEK